MRHHVPVALDRGHQAQRLEIGHDPPARLEPVESAIRLRCIGVDAPDLVQDRDRLEPVPTADLEIVEVVGRRDLDRAGALLGIGVCVGHDRDPSADQRQDAKRPCRCR